MDYCQNGSQTLSILGKTIIIGGKYYFSDSSDLFSFYAPHFLYPPSPTSCFSLNMASMFPLLDFCIGSSFLLVDSWIDDVLSFCSSICPHGFFPSFFKAFSQIFPFYQLVPAMPPKLVNTPLQASNIYPFPALYSL